MAEALARTAGGARVAREGEPDPEGLAPQAWWEERRRRIKALSRQVGAYARRYGSEPEGVATPPPYRICRRCGRHSHTRGLLGGCCSDFCRRGPPPEAPEEDDGGD